MTKHKHKHSEMGDYGIPAQKLLDSKFLQRAAFVFLLICLAAVIVW